MADNEKCPKCQSENVVITPCMDIEDGIILVNDSLFNGSCLDCHFEYLIVDV